MSIVVILNPRAGRGKTAEVWAKVQPFLRESVDVLETSAAGHASELAAQALKSGVRTIVAVGGDGTINEVVNGFFQDEVPIAADARLAIVPHGTSSDFARSLKLPSGEVKAAQMIVSGDVRAMDVMKIRCTTLNGASVLRYGVNVTSFGMGGAVAARANRSSKPLGGRLAFLMATLQTAMDFNGASMKLVIDDLKIVDARITNVAVGNGQFHGSGMWVCPGAAVDDGLLDVTIVKYLTAAEIVRNLPMLYNGTIYQHPKIAAYRAKSVRADSSDLALIEIDGEPVGKLPLEIQIVPRAINVLMP